MALTSATLSLALQYAFEKANTGFADTKVGPKRRTYTLGSSAAWDSLRLVEYSIAASGTQTIDMSAFTDLAGTAITPSKALVLILIPTGAGVKLEPGASDPLTWFFAGTTPSVSIPVGGLFVYAEPVGQTVDATHKNLKLTNLSGSVTLTVDVIAGTLD